MEISDEIRKWCDETTPWPTRADARAIADRIDREMVELPKDADGEVIHVGDTLYDRESGEEIQVDSLRFNGQWEIRTVLGYIMPCWRVHKHPDSLECIADEIEDAEGWCDQNGDYGTGISSVGESTLREWADRIRKLAEKEDE